MNSPIAQPEKKGSSKVWLVLIQIIDIITFFPGVMIMVALDDLLSLHIYESGNRIARFALGYFYPVVGLILILISWQLYRKGKFNQAILLSLLPIFFVAISVFIWIAFAIFVMIAITFR